MCTHVNTRLHVFLLHCIVSYPSGHAAGRRSGRFVSVVSVSPYDHTVQVTGLRSSSLEWSGSPVSDRHQGRELDGGSLFSARIHYRVKGLQLGCAIVAPARDCGKTI